VFALCLAFTVAAALTLRVMAERNRQGALEALSVCRIAAVGEKDAETLNRKLTLLIERVDGLEEGAFAPLSRQPFVRALLVPLSSAGGLALLEYLVLGR